jgi:hypothetical protein
MAPNRTIDPGANTDNSADAERLDPQQKPFPKKTSLRRRGAPDGAPFFLARLQCRCLERFDNEVHSNQPARAGFDPPTRHGPR